jgi:hypothetical protein
MGQLAETARRNGNSRASSSPDLALDIGVHQLPNIRGHDPADIVRYTVSRSLVTVGPGLEVRDVITGFAIAVIHIENLPVDARPREILDLLVQQGLSEHQSCLLRIWEPKGQETKTASVAIPEDLTLHIAAALDDLEFRNTRLKLKLLSSERQNIAYWLGYTRESTSLPRSLARYRHGVNKSTSSCQVCFDDEPTLPIWLDCGHVYCQECICRLVASFDDTGHLPLTCIGKETRCQKPMPLSLIRSLLPKLEHDKLIEKAFRTYADRGPGDFKNCITPDCNQIIRFSRSAVPMELACPSCSKGVCVNCGKYAHGSRECIDPRASKETLADWINLQGDRCKRCPRCTMAIEKLEGCNHLSCRSVRHPRCFMLGVF